MLDEHMIRELGRLDGYKTGQRSAYSNAISHINGLIALYGNTEIVKGILEDIRENLNTMLRKV